MNAINEILATGNYEIVGGNATSVILAPKSNGNFTRSLRLASAADEIATRHCAKCLPTQGLCRIRIAK